VGTNEIRSSVTPRAASNSYPSTRRPSAAVVRRTGTAIDEAQGEAAIVRVREQARALITNDAMENVTALSAFEGQCIEMAPLAEPRLKALVDGYALAAAQAIVHYGR
jgi:hypothetical protein